MTAQPRTRRNVIAEPTRSTLVAVIEEARSRYFSGTPIKDLVDQYADTRFTGDDLNAIIRAGLTHILSQSVAKDRTGRHTAINDTPIRPAIQFAPQRSQGAAGYHALARVFYEGADGVPKSLMDFTAADCEARAAAERRLEAGAARRREFFTTATAHLAHERKSRISALTVATLRQLEDHAQQAFGRAVSGSETENKAGLSESSGRAS